MAGVLPFADFLDLLRAAGVPVGIGDYENLGLLLARWRGTDADELGSAVAALLARSPAESARIVELFSQYCAELPPKRTALERDSHPQPPAPPLPRSVVPWALGVGGALLLAALVGTVWFYRGGEIPTGSLDLSTTAQPDQAVSAPTADFGVALDAGSVDAARPDLRPPADLASPPEPTLPDAQTISGLRLGLAAFLAALVGLLLGVLLDFRWSRRGRSGIWRAKLDELPGPRYYALPLAALQPAFSREELDGLASVFDRLRVVSAGRRQLDVPRTLHRTLCHAQPPLAFQPEALRRPLLVLRDQGQDMRIWASKIRDLLDGLSVRGILLSTYTFVGDARRLRPDSGGPEHDLFELWSSHLDSAILVLSTGLHAVDARSGQPADWVKRLTSWQRLTWVNPIGDPELFAPGLQSLPVRVWPMTYWGLLSAAYSLLHDVNQHFLITTQRLYRTRPVGPDDVKTLCRLLALAPAATPALAEYFRQRFAPEVPEEVILYLRAASLQPGGELLQFPPAAPAPLSRKEEAALRLLRDLTEAAAPPVGSAAELRWRLDRALLDLRLPDPRGVSHPNALKVLATLAQSPLCEEVSERIGEIGAGEAAPSALRSQLAPLFRANLRGKRSSAQTLKVAIATAATVVIVLVGILLPTKLLDRKLTPKEGEQLISGWIERGRELLVSDKPEEGLLWLQRAYQQGSRDSSLLVLLHQAMIPLNGIWTPVRTLQHDSDVLACAFSPDGKRIITGSIDNTVRIWGADSESVPVLLRGHASSIDAVAFSPDGNKVATGSSDYTVRIWGADGSGAPIVLRGSAAGISSVSFTSDGKRIAAGSLDGSVRIWRVDGSGEPVVLTVPAGAVTSVAFSPDGNRLAVGSVDARTRIWSADVSREPLVLTGHAGAVTTVAFSPDGRKVATGSRDQTARFWNADGLGTPVVVTTRAPIFSVGYRPDGLRVVTADQGGSALIWEAETGQLFSELKGPKGSSVRQVAYSADGKRIVTASSDKTARVWQALTSPLQAVLQASADGLGGVLGGDISRAIGGGLDSGIGALTGRLGRGSWDGHGGVLGSAAYSPDSRRIVTTGGKRGAQVWDAEAGLLIAELDVAATSSVSASYSPDGLRIITASADGAARVWDSATGRLTAELRGHTRTLTSAKYSPDGTSIVTASEDGTARIWTAGAGAAVSVLAGHEDSVLDAMFSPDGRRIVTASGDKTARIWDAKTGRLVSVLEGHTNKVLHAVFSPDTKRIVTASEDGAARVWDAESGRLVVALTGSSGTVHSAQYSPDGRRIVTASSDALARVWDAESGRILLVLKGHQKDVTSAAFSPDGRQVVTASSDTTAKVWDAAGGLLLVELKGHTAEVEGASYSPDGRRVVTASRDGTARVWDLSPETRTPSELAARIQCFLPLRFERTGSDVIVARKPNPAACPLSRPTEAPAITKSADSVAPHDDPAPPEEVGIPVCSVRSSGGLGSLRNAWGSAANDLWAVDAPGTIYHYDGTRWTARFQTKNQQLYGVWGTQRSDVWVTGFGGLLLHYDGTSWRSVPSGTSVSLLAVRGSSPAELWAVGHGGLLLHYQAGTWSRVDSGVTSDLVALWDGADASGWAVGWNGTILHRRGASWTLVPSGTTHDLTSVWGSGPEDLWVVGKGGFLSHYDGTRWTATPSGTTSNFWSVFGTSKKDVWAAGVGPLLHYDGVTWRSVQKGTTRLIIALGGDASKGVWAVAEDGTILGCSVRPPQNSESKRRKRK